MSRAAEVVAAEAPTSPAEVAGPTRAGSGLREAARSPQEDTGHLRKRTVQASSFRAASTANAGTSSVFEPRS
jgi:hypothetical protein